MSPLVLLLLAALPVHRTELRVTAADGVRVAVRELRPDKARPGGAIEDSFVQASGRRLYDAGDITAVVLLVRGTADFWSRPEDLQAFAHDAVHARRVRVLEIPGGSHFLHLERAEAGRAALLDALSETLRPEQ